MTANPDRANVVISRSKSHNRVKSKTVIGLKNLTKITEIDAVEEQEVEKFARINRQGYQIVEPTLTNDDGPNCRDKVYNRIKVNYNFSETRDLKARAKCQIEIPVEIMLEKPKVKPGELPSIDVGPTKEEWGLPIKFIIKQGDVQFGEDFKKPRHIDFFLSQQTETPSRSNHEQHVQVNFNVKSKDNYDKVFGTNEIYSFTFKPNFIKELMR